MIHIIAGILGTWFVYTALYGMDIGPSEVAIGLFLSSYFFGMAYLIKS